MSAAVPSRPPVLVELDDAFWRGQLDRTEAFLDTVVPIQAGFRAMAEDVAARVEQPQFRHFLEDIAEDARRHEAQIGDFYRMIGRDPARGRTLLGALAAKGRELLAGAEGLVSGAGSRWHDLRQLWQSSHSAEGAFGVVEQLGYALGLKEFAELGHKLANEKHRGTLVIQEIVLEMAAVAVLYDGPTDDAFGPRTQAGGPFLPDRG